MDPTLIGIVITAIVSIAVAIVSSAKWKIWHSKAVQVVDLLDTVVKAAADKQFTAEEIEDIIRKANIIIGRGA